MLGNSSNVKSASDGRCNADRRVLSQRHTFGCLECFRMRMLRAKLKAFGPTRQIRHKTHVRTYARTASNRLHKSEPRNKQMSRSCKHRTIRTKVKTSDKANGRQTCALSLRLHRGSIFTAPLGHLRGQTKQSKNRMFEPSCETKTKGKLRTCQNKRKQTQSLRRPQNM